MNTIQIIDKYKPPEIKDSDISPSNYYSVQFTFSSPTSKNNFHNEAVELAVHMDIISESRNLIKKGEIMTWEELENESKR